MGARLSYALVANVLIGIGGSALVIRVVSRAGTVSTQQAGFRARPRRYRRRSWRGARLRFLRLAGRSVLEPGSLHQRLRPGARGLHGGDLVCWAVVGSVSQALLQDRGRWISLILAAIVASILFGFYHFAHNPRSTRCPWSCS